MQRHKKLIIVASLLGAFIIGSAATTPAYDEHDEYKNLKVLPKKTTHDEMQKIMKSWNVALGVKCNFCHSPRKDNPEKLDFASDAKHEKDIARSMYKMTMKINKKYFGHEKEEHEGAAILEVDCITCHRGKPHADK